MKKILLLSIVLVLVGCASTSTSTTNTTSNMETDPVAAYPPLIQSASAVATGTVLQFAIKDANERTALANQIYSTASGVRTMLDGTVPTEAQLQNTLDSYSTGAAVPDAYNAYVGAITAIYSTYYGKLKGNPKYAAEVLEALASGAESGAKTYTSISQ